MKRHLSNLVFALVVIGLFIGAYLSWANRDTRPVATEETLRAQQMDEAARRQAEKMTR